MNHEIQEHGTGRVSEVLDDVIMGAQLVPLSQAVEVNPKIDRSALHDDLDVSFVPMAAVEALTGGIDVSTIRKYAEVKKGYTHFRDGDILFAKVTPCMENGKMAIARQLINGVGFGSTEFHVLRPRAGVDARYIYYFVSSQTFLKEASGHMTGAVGLRRVPSAYLEEQLIPLPGIEQQREIVAELEKQFSRLDEAVANLQRVKANLKRYKASVLKDAVEGRLVPTEAELARREGRSFETGEQLLQRILEVRRSGWQGRGKYKVPVAQDMNELFALPDGWTAASVEQLTSLVEYGSSARTNEDSAGVPVLRMGNIFNGELVFDNLKYLPTDHDEFPKLFVEPGDLLFNRTNSPELVGKTAVFKGAAQPFAYASYLIRIRVVNGYAPDFLAGFLNSSHGREWVKRVVTQQVGQANVNGTKLQALVVPLPPCVEQRRIVSELERRLSLISGVKSEVDANLNRAQALRQAMLMKCFHVEPGAKKRMKLV